MTASAFSKVLLVVSLTLIASTSCSFLQDEPARVTEKFLRASLSNDIADLQETVDPDYGDQIMTTVFLQMGLSAFVGGAQQEFAELRVQTTSNDGRRANVRAQGKIKTVALGTQMTIPFDTQIPLVNKNGRWYVTISAAQVAPTSALPRTVPTATSQPVTIIRGNLRAVFLGQDGASYAGRLCQSGTIPDNIHIHLDGMKRDVKPVAYRIEDRAEGGVWATPCNPVSNWLIFATTPTVGQADLYFKPFRDAPDGTQYTIFVQYSDGTGETITVIGSRVSLNVSAPSAPTVRQGSLRATFLGQDGGGYAGRQCESGTALDNVHIRLDGVRTDVKPVAYRIEDRAGGGLWATPCNPVSNWLIFAISPASGQLDLYFKPFRDAPDGTQYAVTIQYSDGTADSVTVIGSRVKP